MADSWTMVLACILGRPCRRGCRTPLITAAGPAAARPDGARVVPSLPMTEARPAASQTFQEKLRTLQQAWRAQLPQRLEEARMRMQHCREHPGDSHALEELHRLLHTLAGSAGTFGEDGLGRQAKEAELAIEELMARPGLVPDDF